MNRSQRKTAMPMAFDALLERTETTKPTLSRAAARSPDISAVSAKSDIFPPPPLIATPVPARPNPSEMENNIGIRTPTNFPINTSDFVTGCARRYCSVPFSLSFDMVMAPVTSAIRGTKRRTRFMRLAAVFP